MRKLVFNFFITKDWRENIIYTIHFNCLQYYNDCFDTVYFAISSEDPSDVQSIAEVKERLIKIFSSAKKVIFEVVENDPLYCEVPTFKREIVDKLGEDTLVFFGHLKGVMDIKIEANPEDIYRRICGLYYFSLKEEHEGHMVSKELLKNTYPISYGAFMTQFLDVLKLHNIHNWYYAGTFFWINSKRLKNYIHDNNITLPEYSDRFYAENFLGDIYPIFAFDNGDTKGDMLAHSYVLKYMLCRVPLNINFNSQIDFLIEGEEETFNQFVEEMKKAQ